MHDPAAGGLSLGYGYDPVGSITELKSGAGSEVLAKYAYDTLGRLTQTQDGATGTPIETYGYDATGNRTSLTTSAGTASYTYPADSHRLIAVDGQARNQDAAGNTTSIGSKTFAYNDANRMSAVKQDAAVVESYGYNHRGERVLRAPASGDAQITVYDEAGQWVGNYSATGQAQQQAIWLDNYPVALIQTATAGVPELAYIQPDHLGTPRVVIDPVRDVAIWEWSNKSEVFGDQAPANDPDGDGVVFDLALRFPGQQATNASGLFYNYQREYEPAVGRYSQSDPIGLEGGVSTFIYATGNSVEFTDPLGLNKQVGVGGSAGGAGPGVAVTGSINVGVSIPKNLGNVSCYQIYGSLQISGMLGGGAYLGAGTSISASESSGRLPDRSWGVYRYSEVAGGWGPSIGGSVQGSTNLLEGNKEGDNWAWLRRLFSLEDMERDKMSGGSISIPPLPGVGFGAMTGSGYTISGQMATPTGKGCGCP
ncbi:RHS repeat-associated core domain-containing protein [Stenotrophomonas indicatrix]|nr:RHS repeat-associated core domain-containing protein [Stenotrophomonas indicatrix]